MTNLEFSNEFDILYNSIATNAAPSIDLYEKSVYLTKAQEELVKNYFNPKGNKYQDGFENSSKRRNDLSQLIKGYNSVFSSQINNNFKQYAISDESKFFKIPKSVFLILQESGKISCNDLSFLTEEEINKSIRKVPTRPESYDEYNMIKDNPFKKADKDKIIRLDYSSEGLDYIVVELLNPHNIIEYNIRYVKYPSPIILGDFATTFSGEGLSINGENSSTPCKLNDSMHREILDRAVELALADYKPEALAIKTQMNSRNE
jgi:hypothetical protein